MNVALCTDDKYVIPCLTTIVSFFENNKDAVCAVYVLTEGLSRSNEEKFKRVSEQYNQTISIKNIDTKNISSLYVSNRFPRSIYSRFFLPEILSDLDKVLYLDCDIMVRHSILDFYDTDLRGFACAVIEDQRGDDITIHNRILMFSRYFNSGVMLINLDYWRKNNVASRLIEYLRQNAGRCWFPDQDALNAVLENQVRFLPYRFNVQGEMLGPRCYLQLSAQKWEELDSCLQDPTIVHFTDMDKPWYKECKHPYKEEYRRYGNLHPLVGFSVCRRDSLSIRFWTICAKICVKILKRLGRDYH